MHYKGLKLDRFQEEAIASIERGHSVIVSAPTGAGKTVIAEYAVEKALEEGERIIYTAPIKALSNQKFRDFGREHGDQIGIMTGDVTINRDAPVLIMTTEIFRNTLFESPDNLQGVTYVIFDEIHYIDDEERGTVWEESIIFAPSFINFICLSATIPNIHEFASWIKRTRECKIDVIEVRERPVPLIHSLYIKGYGVGTVKDLRQLTLPRSSGSRRHRTRWRSPRRFHQEISKEDRQKRGEKGEDELLDYLVEHDQLPCLYFSFSRRACESKAFAHLWRDLLNPEEKHEIEEYYSTLCEQYDIQGERSAMMLSKLVANGIA
ncbi:MAG: DEAD/DEAH box helicase, partial [Candidatus Tectomicrobia bacterium]|nr:DEAD/DEAH box helicase [Candidatus Tectomicrobia bacterium]